MIGIDTNILLRYLTKDDVAQLSRIRELFETGEQLLVCDVVLAETVWGLRTIYRIAKADIVRQLQEMIENDIFAFDDPPVVYAAFADYRDGNGDFADYLIGRRNTAAGCEHTVTFDKDLIGHPSFVVI